MKYLVGFLVAIGLLAGATQTFAAFSPTGGGTYRLGSSIGTSNTTVKLSSFKEPVSNIPYTMSYLNSDIGYGTIDPQTTRSEFVSFSGVTQNSDGTALLTGVTRGLTRTPRGVGCTASTTLAQAHPGQSIFILSDSPCLFAEYIPLRTTATSSAQLVFGSTTPPRYDYVGAQGSGTYNATTSEFASIEYVNKIAISSASNATESIKGIVELATQLESASSSVTGSTGAGLVLQARYATSSPGSICGVCIPTTDANGKLRQNFLDLTQGFNFSSTTNLSATTTIAASSTLGNALILNGLKYAFSATRGASSTVLSENGSGSLSWAAIQHVVSVVSNNDASATAATTSVRTVIIPANTISTVSQLRITALYTGTGVNQCNYGLAFGNGTATSTIGFANNRVTPGTAPISMSASVIATSTSAGLAYSTSYNYTPGFSVNPATGGNIPVWLTAAWLPYNFAALTYIDFQINNINNTTCNLASESVEVIQ